jgi:hypothetical protein
MPEQQPPEVLHHADPAKVGTVTHAVSIGCSPIEQTPSETPAPPPEVAREPLIVARTMDDVERMLRRR